MREPMKDMMPHVTGVEIKVHGRPYVPVLINGCGPFWLLLDTGCVGCRVTTSVAQQVGLHPDEHAVAVLDTVAIADSEWRNVRFGVADDPAVARLLGRDFDGFLGNGFIYYVRDDFDVFIDYPGRKLAFCRRTRTSRQTDLCAGTAISIENYYAVVPASVNGQGARRFLLDTGASTCIVSRSLALELGLRDGGPAEALGAANALPAYRSRVARLSVGRATCEGLDVLVMDCSHVSAYVTGEIDGYIGTNFLRNFRLHLSYADQVLQCC